jgi:Predicted membrane protein (DUF2306)
MSASRQPSPIRNWAPPAFLIALGVGAMAIALNNLLAPTAVQAASVADFAGKDYLLQLAAFDRNPLLIRSHAAMGATFVLIAAFQFWRGFRARFPRAHRIMGRVGLALLVALPTTGVACSIVYPFAGPAGVTPNVVWMLAVTTCVVMAWRTILARDVLGHQVWVTRATALTLGITLSRLYEPVLIHAFHMQARPALALVFWLGQGEGLAVAEVWLRRPGGPLARKAAMRKAVSASAAPKAIEA